MACPSHNCYSTASLWHSIGNWRLLCESHYRITNNQVRKVVGERIPVFGAGGYLKAASSRERPNNSITIKTLFVHSQNEHRSDIAMKAGKLVI